MNQDKLLTNVSASEDDTGDSTESSPILFAVNNPSTIFKLPRVSSEFPPGRGGVGGGGGVRIADDNDRLIVSTTGNDSFVIDMGGEDFDAVEYETGIADFDAQSNRACKPVINKQDSKAN